MTTVNVTQTTDESQGDLARTLIYASEPQDLAHASTLVVFDSRVSDLDILHQALLPGSIAERGLCPIGFTIRAHADGLETITDLLAATGAKYLAIVAHGEAGVVHLGKNPLNLAQIQSQS